jgi:hypothetical protein
MGKYRQFREAQYTQKLEYNHMARPKASLKELVLDHIHVCEALPSLKIKCLSPGFSYVKEKYSPCKDRERDLQWRYITYKAPCGKKDCDGVTFVNRTLGFFCVSLEDLQRAGEHSHDETEIEVVVKHTIDKLSPKARYHLKKGMEEHPVGEHKKSIRERTDRIRDDLRQYAKENNLPAYV